ncbi:unnamed protein product [Brachionus calyciflorus]|uniref:t-SNARE coiled-coil homology domain-containing protein n=1 Tax=Brachionus calyciflorus TaxID=104777 RepID=A0A814LK88_9BILA|nr:unnamed protein product [Brachionus calyciflorus]
MTSERIRNFAQHTIQAGQILLNSANDISNINQQVQANRDLPNMQANLALILQNTNNLLQRLDGIDERLNNIDERLDNIDERLDNIDERLDNIDERLDNIDERFDELVDHNDARMYELAIMTARAVNVSCVRLSSPIQWIKLDERPLPHHVPTLNDLYNLDRREVNDFLEYYNLQPGRSLKAERMTLGSFHGIPGFLE